MRQHGTLVGTALLPVLFATAIPQLQAQNVPLLSKSRIGFHVIRAQGIKVDFRSLRGATISEPPGLPSTSFVQYDDGYVGVDDRNWPFDNPPVYETSYWGYNNASQVNGNQVTLSRALSTNTWSLENFEETDATGFGINTQGRKGSLTFTAGFNWIPVDAEYTAGGQATFESISDSFTYLGSTVPAAPHAGLSSDTGSILNMSGTRQYNSAAGTDTITGSLNVDGILHQFHIGSQIEKTLEEKYRFTLGLAITANLLNADFTTSHQVTRNGTQIASSGSSVSDSHLQVGVSGGAGFIFLLDDNNQLYVEWQKQYMSETEITNSLGETAVISYDDLQNVNIGMRFQF